MGKIRKSQTTTRFFYFTFLCRKTYTLLENIFEKLNLYCYISIIVFSRGGLWEMRQ